MKNKTPIPSFTEHVINSIQISPEFTSLKSIRENNICHDNETVYHHSLAVVKRLTELLNLYSSDKKTGVLAKLYFSVKIGRFTKRDLFILGAYLHDIGKADTIQKNEEGITSCPGHEARSADIATGMLISLGLRNEEIEYVADIIKLHGGYSLRFLDYLRSLSKTKLREVLNYSYYLPEIFMYMIVDNEFATTFTSYKRFILEEILPVEDIYKVKENSQRSMKRLDEIIKMAISRTKKYSKPWTLEARMLHLSEEVGELHDIYLQYLGLKDRKQEMGHLIGGVNDILLELLAIYDYLGVDISDALEEELSEK